jgi:hypothetical protein
LRCQASVLEEQIVLARFQFPPIGTVHDNVRERFHYVVSVVLSPDVPKISGYEVFRVGPDWLSYVTLQWMVGSVLTVV